MSFSPCKSSARAAQPGAALADEARGRGVLERVARDAQHGRLLDAPPSLVLEVLDHVIHAAHPDQPSAGDAALPRAGDAAQAAVAALLRLAGGDAAIEQRERSDVCTRALPREVDARGVAAPLGRVRHGVPQCRSHAARLGDCARARPRRVPDHDADEALGSEPLAERMVLTAIAQRPDAAVHEEQHR